MPNDARIQLSAALLDRLASLCPSPIAKKHARMGKTPGSEGYGEAYARHQFMSKVWHGTPLGEDMPSLLGKDVIEIGCGHGGITCYLASLGARRVVGVDINTANVLFGEALAREIAEQRGAEQLPVEFREMNASALEFADASFDVVVAENVFEHFDDPEAVMREAFRVLRPAGKLLVPVFSSIVSKHGLHLKNGIRLPWTNLVFSEATIVEAMKRRARRHPELLEIYPGLRGEPTSVRDLRKYRDLNDITYPKFLAMARRAGFVVRAFRVHETSVGRVLARVIPRVKDSRVTEVLSTGAAAVLEKPA